MSDTAQPGGEIAAPAIPVATPTGAGQAPVQADNTGAAANPEPNDPADDPGAASPDRPERPSRGVQKRIDELSADKHHYRREAEYWREQAIARQQPQQQQPQGPQPLPPDLAAQVGAPPDPSKFHGLEFDEGYIKQKDDYLVRLAEARVEARFRQQAQQQHQQQAAHQLGQRLDTIIQQGREKYADFDSAMDGLAVLRDPQRSNFLRAQVAQMEDGAAVAYYLAKNPKDAERIAGARDAAAMARELGRIEARVTAQAPAPQPTAAPNPPRPVRGAATSSKGSYETMSVSDIQKLITG